MNFSNFLAVTAIAVTFLLNTKEVSLSFLDNVSPKAVLTEEIIGGPRTVIQAMTEVVVIQPTATNLQITIIDSEGIVVAEQATQSLQTTISTVGFKQGTYSIETVDDYEDIQIFTITI